MKNMNNIIKNLCVFALSTLALAGCIKETFPESATVTADQLGESASATESSINGIPAQMAQGYLIYGNQTSELDMGIPGLFIALSECTGEMFPLADAGYDHYQRFNTCKDVGKTTARSYVPWRTLYILVKSANDVIGAVKQPTEATKPYKGMALAYRAYFYWMLMNLYEPVANEYVDCSKVLNLTVPKVTEETTEAMAKNNPRITHDEMVKFILSDLTEAVECLKDAKITDKGVPSLAVVYGLMARTYMSNKDYANAEKYARLAITTSGCKPMTQAQWEDVNTGFNTANDAWMWKISYSAENMGKLCNWIGWMSGEANWGYGSLTMPGIDAGLYNAIPDTDWRKHSWLDPDRYNYYDYKSCREEKFIKESCPDYMSIKFRPVGGDYKTYSIGGVCDVPLMRVEEMYLIEAEAKGLQILQNGIDALEDFMVKIGKRQLDYTCSASNVEAFEKEILFQKKIEFWGEGIAFFDAKRMGAGCTQSYVGTNAPGDNFKINCNVIKPNWNFVIPESEESSNTAIATTNNPDPSGSVTPDLRY